MWGGQFWPRPPFEAALRKGDQRRLKSRLAAKIGGPTLTTFLGKLL